MASEPAETASAESGVCGVCGRRLPHRELVAADLVRPQIAALLTARTPDWRRTGLVCREDLGTARRAYVEKMLREERGELTRLDHAVIDSIAERGTLSADTANDYHEALSFGDRMADRVAAFGGSWTFILSFAAVLVVWIGFNSAMLFAAGRFDPYPYILLNLVLSCLAAIQAPLIMMSQRRQEAKDRLRSENDYAVNLKAELEIRQIQEKLDHLLIRQWQRLAEIQQIQLEIMEDLDRRNGAG